MLKNVSGLTGIEVLVLGIIVIVFSFIITGFGSIEGELLDSLENNINSSIISVEKFTGEDFDRDTVHTGQTKTDLELLQDMLDVVPGDNVIILSSDINSTQWVLSDNGSILSRPNSLD